MNIDIIFAEACVGVWKDRVRSGECTMEEFNDAMIDNINLTKQDAKQGLPESGGEK